MKVEEIMQLVNAGFTKSEIMQLAGAGKEQTPDAPKGVDDKAKPEPNVPKEGQGEDPAGKVMQDMIKGLNESIAGLQKTIQQANIKGAYEDSKPRSIDEQADEAIFELLK